PATAASGFLPGFRAGPDQAGTRAPGRLAGSPGRPTRPAAGTGRYGPARAGCAGLQGLRAFFAVRRRRQGRPAGAKSGPPPRPAKRRCSHPAWLTDAASPCAAGARPQPVATARGSRPEPALRARTVAADRPVAGPPGDAAHPAVLLWTTAPGASGDPPTAEFAR